MATIAPVSRSTVCSALCAKWVRPLFVARSTRRIRDGQPPSSTCRGTASKSAVTDQGPQRALSGVFCPTFLVLLFGENCKVVRLGHRTPVKSVLNCDSTDLRQHVTVLHP